MFRSLIVLVFSATFGFVLIGLVIVAGSAILEAFGEAEMEDGRMLKEHLQENKQQLKDAYGPIFEDVDGEKILKEDMKELHDIGKEAFDSSKTKTKKFIEEVKEVKEYIEEE